MPCTDPAAIDAVAIHVRDARSVSDECYPHHAIVHAWRANANRDRRDTQANMDTLHRWTCRVVQQPTHDIQAKYPAPSCRYIVRKTFFALPGRLATPCHGCRQWE